MLQLRLPEGDDWIDAHRAEGRNHRCCEAGNRQHDAYADERQGIGGCHAKQLRLVIAPHPYYPARCCLGQLLDRHADLFDAVELNACYTSQVDHFNRKAISWARRVGKPVVANADVHRLKQLGTTFSLVDAAPEPDAICAAIREGRVEVQTRPLSFVEAAAHLAGLALGDLMRTTRASAPAGHPLGRNLWQRRLVKMQTGG